MLHDDALILQITFPPIIYCIEYDYTFTILNFNRMNFLIFLFDISVFWCHNAVSPSITTEELINLLVDYNLYENAFDIASRFGISLDPIFMSLTLLYVFLL